MSDHKFEIILVDDEKRKHGITGFQLQHLTMISPPNESTFPCDCGFKVPIPHGSLAKYVEELKKTHAPSTMVTIGVTHSYGSDPIKEAAELEELSKHSNQTIHDKDGKLKELGYVQEGNK